MLTLDDFVHLPLLDRALEQMWSDAHGLIVIAGLDAPPPDDPSDREFFLPSGRTTIFRIVMNHILGTFSSHRALVVARDRSVVRVPRSLRGRVRFSLIQPPSTCAQVVAASAGRHPELLVVEHMTRQNVHALLEAAGKVRVLTQFDTVFCGGAIIRQLLDWGVARQELCCPLWIVTVQRLSMLCSHCRHPVSVAPAQLAHLRHRHFVQVLEKEWSFFDAEGCAACNQTGRRGDLAAFDVFHARANSDSLFQLSSLLPIEEYLLHLAGEGYLAFQDVIFFDADQLRRTYTLLTSSESNLAETNSTLVRKLSELEAAYRVLQQRTEALISLQDIGQALISSTHLEQLSARVCRHMRDLCGAERSILYFMRADGQAEVLAVSGWTLDLIHRKLETDKVFPKGIADAPHPFNGWPPGVPRPSLEAEMIQPRAGLRVPLVAQNERVGMMIVHSTQKTHFLPGEVALLQTFAHQAALAIQRAGLFKQLEDKIMQLEAAQVELVKKERLERELELARQVQQSVLPRVFPQMAGYAFAANNKPARQVGGDFYDVVRLGDDCFGLVIADVSDKGMPAALYMALTRSLLLAEARRERSPRAVLTNVNRLLLELGEPNMFVTVFYGVVDRATKKLTYTRAGHDRPLLLRGTGVQWLEGRGAFLGVLGEEELHLSEEQLALSAGDRLVLYTDGLTDIQDLDGQLYDRERFELLLQSHDDLDLTDFCTAIFDDLSVYQGDAEQFDDMTMLVVEVL